MTASARTAGPAPVAVAALVLAWLAALAWLRPLALPDEGRYVGVAWEMLRSGDWLVPTLNGLPYFHKPPLFYWVTAAALWPFGPGELAARAAPLFGAWLAAFATYLFVRRWWDERAARWALVPLLAQPLFYGGAQYANLDMLVAGCITLTIVLLAHAALRLERGGEPRGFVLGAYAAAALGVLAKGLIGVVLPALVVGVWLLVGRRWRTLWALLSPGGALLFLLLAAPWFVAVEWRHPGFLDYFFVVQHFKRYAESGFNNVQPFWFYPVVLLVVTLPWLAWLRPQAGRGRLADPVRGDLRLLMLLWLGLVLLFFSLPQSKLLGYLLPVLPPLAVLIGDGFESRLASSPRHLRWWWASAGVGAALSVALLAWFAVQAPRSTQALGAALRQGHAADEPVFMLAHYYFDLPYYGRLRQPVTVVLDWNDPQVRQGDTWRKELADAGDFAPSRERARLMQPEAFEQASCAHAVNWVVGPSGAVQAYPSLAEAQAVAEASGTTLWRLERGGAGVNERLACAERPSVGSATTSPAPHPAARPAAPPGSPGRPSAAAPHRTAG